MNDSEHKQVIANNIRRLMEQRGITNQQICADLNIKYTTFVDWINAKAVPRISKIELMANYFNVRKSDLIEDNGNPAKSAFANNLKQYIEKTGKTQREVAEAAGVSAPTFSDWINAKKFPRIDKIQKLADYFGILKSDLIEDKDTPANNVSVQKETYMFAETLKALRESRGITQTALAEAMNVIPSLISMYESNQRKPSFEMLIALADYFGVSISALFGDTRLNDANIEVSELRRKFSRNLKRIREQNGYTQGELAYAVGISKSAISMYENGNREPDFATLEALAHLFGVPVGVLVGDTITDNRLSLYELVRTIPDEKIALVTRVINSLLITE